MRCRCVVKSNATPLLPVPEVLATYITLLHPDIKIHILHTVLNAFPVTDKESLFIDQELLKSVIIDYLNPRFQSASVILCLYWK